MEEPVSITLLYVKEGCCTLAHWLSQGLTFAQLAGMYVIAKSTAVKIVHNGVTVLRHNLVSASIKFPIGTELEQMISDFEAICGLPLCAGALDDTFMRIKKLTE